MCILIESSPDEKIKSHEDLIAEEKNLCQQQLKKISSSLQLDVNSFRQVLI